MRRIPTCGAERGRMQSRRLPRPTALPCEHFAFPRSAQIFSKYLHRFCVVQPQKQTLHGFDVVSRQHRFRNRKKLTNKVEVRIVRHSPVTLLPQLGAPLGSAYMLRGAYEKVRVDQAWSCGRDAHLSVRCIRRRRCVTGPDSMPVPMEAWAGPMAMAAA